MCRFKVVSSKISFVMDQMFFLYLGVKFSWHGPLKPVQLEKQSLTQNQSWECPLKIVKEIAEQSEPHVPGDVGKNLVLWNFRTIWHYVSEFLFKPSVWPTPHLYKKKIALKKPEMVKTRKLASVQNAILCHQTPIFWN